MITREAFFKHGRPSDPELMANAETTIVKGNQLILAFRDATGDKDDRSCTSGYRPPQVNASIPGAALRSNHMKCLAVDIRDADGDLDEWCLDNPEVLERIGLWQEHPSATKSWAHFQTVPPKSGKRVFYP